MDARFVFLPTYKNAPSSEERKTLARFHGSHASQISKERRSYKSDDRKPIDDQAGHVSNTGGSTKKLEPIAIPRDTNAYTVPRRRPSRNSQRSKASLRRRPRPHVCASNAIGLSQNDKCLTLAIPRAGVCSDASHFAVAGIRMTPDLNRLLHLAEDWYMSAIWPIISNEYDRRRALIAWHHTADHATQNPSHMHALIACAAHYKALSIPKSSERATIVSLGFEHKVRSLKMLREILRKTDTEREALDVVLSLAAAEFYAKETGSAILHQEAAAALIDRLGGFDCIDTATRTIFMLGNVCVRGWALETSFLPTSFLDLGEAVIQPWAPYVLNANFGGSKLDEFGNVAHDQSNTWFDVGLVRVAGYVHESILVKEATSLQSPIEPHIIEQVSFWLHNRRCVIKTCCLDGYIRLQSRKGHMPSEVISCAYLAVMLCHGLVIYHDLQSLVIHEPLPFFADRVKNIVQKDEQEWDVRHNELLLWLLFVNAIMETISHAHKGIYSIGWAGHKFVSHLRRINIENLRKVEETLQSYFYYRRAMRPYLCHIINRLDPTFNTA